MAIEINRLKVLSRLLKSTSIGLLVAPLTLLNATPLSLGTTPLFLGSGVDSNIILTLDDSGSMHWEHMPDGIGTAYVYPRVAGLYGAGDYSNRVTVFSDVHSYSVRNRSPDVNLIYYNPAITYVPWEGASGTMGDALITCAPHNPFDTAKGCRDLTAENDEEAAWVRYNGGSYTVSASDVSESFWPAVYFRYTGGGNPNWTASDYTEFEIRPATPSYPGGPERTDCGATPTTCTYSQEIQNFANWYTYYRSRVLTARGGIGRAFANQSTNIRVGFAAINRGTTTIDGVSSSRAMVRGVRPFSGSDRDTFYNDLYGHTMVPSGTPLRTALRGVGAYFERTDDDGPWGGDPGNSNAASHLECRQSFNILMTDGYYNGGNPGLANIDDTAGTTITGPGSASFLYTPGAPYRDAYSDTLADSAMDYWVRDLRPTLANRVPTNTTDDAFWQHLVNFTVGLGVNGSLDPVADLPGILAGSTPWPDPTTNDATHIDDLWHAGINSRGGFFSAADPNEFAKALGDILGNISDRTRSSSASVAINSGSIVSDSLVYQSRFNSTNWTGQLSAFPINADGSLGAEEWEASASIPASNARVIITHDGLNPQRFRWTDLSATQQALLTASQVVDYIRGDGTLEKRVISDPDKTTLGSLGLPAEGFRNRINKNGDARVLGDLVHSAPSYVGVGNFRYPDSLEALPYSSFVASQRLLNSGSGRNPVVYVGANDGMLHAFDARDKASGGGVELFAYVPNKIYSRLLNHADPQGNHQYTVDGSPSTVDAFVGGSWKTILVSGLRGGGQGFFAIDITDPSAFSTEISAKNKVLWEFTDSDMDPGSSNANFDSDLGYTFGKASIVRLHNGKWAAVFGNGYNNTFDNDGDGVSNDSATGNAVLYIVDLETGDLIKKIDTGKGSSADLSGSNFPNGLSQPALVDTDGDSIIDYAYAGDLQGNLWKFDLTSVTAASWGVAHSQPLYTACASNACTAATFQPITSPLKVKHHPESGLMIYFGTGKYFETGDNTPTGQTNQTFYGIWDKNVAIFTSFNRSALLEQSITQELQFRDSVTNLVLSDVRVSTDNAIDWAVHSGWYMDLYNKEGGNTNNYGERQVSSAILRGSRVMFSTLIPGDLDPCSSGGVSWFMVLDVFSGARLAFTPFDFSGDGEFDENDYVSVNGTGIPGSGRKSKVGITSTPGLVTKKDGNDVAIFSGSGDKNDPDGDIDEEVDVNGEQYSPGRESWRQLNN